MKNKDISKVSKKEQRTYLTAIKDIEQKIENMFHDLWHKNMQREDVSDFFSFGAFNTMPKIDVVDREKEIFVKAELPGIDKKDIDVSLTENQLVIKAKTCHEEKEEKGDYLKQEIRKSEVYRSVLLPADIDADKVKTSFKNGVLELTIPKREGSHRKRIEVK
jgi:HSP20 family protein